MVEKKSRHAAVILLLVLVTAMTVSESAFALGPPGPPSLFLMFERTDQSVAAGCPTVNAVRLISQIGFEGKVTLVVVNPPAGVNVTFTPNPVYVPAFYENTSLVTVSVMPNTPQGKVNLTVVGVSNAYRTPNDTKPLTINVLSPCVQLSNTKGTTAITTTTTTVTTTVTTTSTLFLRQDGTTSTTSSTTTTTTTKTLTNITTEQVTDSSTYAWAVSATVAALVLAVILVMQRRPRTVA